MSAAAKASETDVALIVGHAGCQRNPKSTAVQVWTEYPSAQAAEAALRRFRRGENGQPIVRTAGG